jgi:glycosyltransferase involved in cell wall biosynthesis
MLELPKISCYCCTYARPKVLEEAIHSFLQQDYEGEKELVILNDCADQNLIYDHPQVKIYNFKERIKPLGKKFNHSVSLCTGDIFMPWEDDDIYLPWRMTTTLRYMTDGLFHTSQGIFEETCDKLIFSNNLFHCNLAISRKNWEKIGGYLNIDKGSVDCSLFSDITKEIRNPTVTILQNEIFYIYRWAETGSYHASGISPYEVCDFAIETEKIVNNQKERNEFLSGDIVLNPRYKYDYLKSVYALFNTIDQPS